MFMTGKFNRDAVASRGVQGHAAALRLTQVAKRIRELITLKPANPKGVGGRRRQP